MWSASIFSIGHFLFWGRWPLLVFPALVSASILGFGPIVFWALAPIVFWALAPRRPIRAGTDEKQKVSELACLAGNSLVRPVGVLWDALEPPIGHMEQKSKTPTINLIIGTEEKLAMGFIKVVDL